MPASAMEFRAQQAQLSACDGVLVFKYKMYTYIQVVSILKAHTSQNKYFHTTSGVEVGFGSTLSGPTSALVL